ncbi:hypothetical protein CI238_12146, partial [Colletotrichum incanum]
MAEQLSTAGYSYFESIKITSAPKDLRHSTRTFQLTTSVAASALGTSSMELSCYPSAQRETKHLEGGKHRIGSVGCFADRLRQGFYRPSRNEMTSNCIDNVEVEATASALTVAACEHSCVRTPDFVEPERPDPNDDGRIHDHSHSNYYGPDASRSNSFETASKVQSMARGHRRRLLQRGAILQPHPRSNSRLEFSRVLPTSGPAARTALTPAAAAASPPPKPQRLCPRRRRRPRRPMDLSLPPSRTRLGKPLRPAT